MHNRLVLILAFVLIPTTLSGSGMIDYLFFYLQVGGCCFVFVFVFGSQPAVRAVRVLQYDNVIAHKRATNLIPSELVGLFFCRFVPVACIAM